MFNLFKFFKKKKQEDLLTADNIFSNNHNHSGAILIDKKNTINCLESCPEVDDELCIELNLIRQRTLQSSDLFTKQQAKFDAKKDTILIIDDNEGMVSFLEDDIEYLEEEGIVDTSKVNVLGLSGSHAGFNFEIMQKRNNGLNIKWAIIDITLGGSIMTKDGIVKYTGVDVLDLLIKCNPDVKFLFYTGNNLNPYIRSNKKIIEKFKNIKNEDISNYVLFKTSMDMDKRRSYISEVLFDKKLNKDDKES